MRRSSLMGFFTVAGALVFAGGEASAQPRPPAPPLHNLPRHVDPNELVPVTVSGVARMMPRHEVLRLLDPRHLVSVGNGRTITVQQFWDHLAAIEDHARKTFRELAAPQRYSSSATPLRTSAAPVHEGLHTAAAAGPASHYGRSIFGTHAEDRTFTTDWQGYTDPWGTQWFAGRVNVNVYDTGTANSISCSADVSADLSVFGNQQTVAYASLTGTAGPSGTLATASVQTFMPWRPVVRYSAPGDHVFQAAAWSTPRIQHSIGLLSGLNGAPLVHVDLAGWIDGSASLSVSNNPVRTAAGGSCSARFVPHVTSTAHFTASASVGLGLGDILTAGVEAEVTPLEVGIPTAVTGSLAQHPRAVMSGSVTSTIAATYMKGRVVAFIELKNPCIDVGPVHLCLIPLRGAIPRINFPIWESAGIPYSREIFNRSSGPIPLASLAPAAIPAPRSALALLDLTGRDETL